jgi:hypothetical protein
MSRYSSRLLIGFLAVCLAVAGCSAITPQGMMMKGAQWAGEQVVKKGYKDYRERKQAKESQSAGQGSQSNSGGSAKTGQPSTTD